MDGCEREAYIGIGGITIRSPEYDKMIRWLKKKYHKNAEIEVPKCPTCRRLSFPNDFNNEHERNLMNDGIYSNLDVTSEHIYTEINDTPRYCSSDDFLNQPMVEIVEDEYEEFNAANTSPFRSSVDDDDGYLVPFKKASTPGMNLQEQSDTHFPKYAVITPEKECRTENKVKIPNVTLRSTSKYKKRTKPRKEVKSWHGRVIFERSEDQWMDVTNEFVFHTNSDMFGSENKAVSVQKSSEKSSFWKKGGSDKKNKKTPENSFNTKGKDDEETVRVSDSDDSTCLSVDSTDSSDESYYCEITTDLNYCVPVFQEMPLFSPKVGFGLNKWYKH